MPHPIYGDPTHHLESVHALVWLPDRPRGLVARAQVIGRASTQRAALWTVPMSWEDGGHEHGYNVGDFVSHALMVAFQDHPTSQRQMDACMVGEGWAQDPML